MAQGPVRTGAFSYLQYDFEMCFGTAPSQADINKVFGYEQKISGWNLTHNRMTLAQLNSVEPITYAYGQTRGSITVDFVLSNPWWFHALYDDLCTTGAGPFTHVYSVCTKLVPSETLEIGICYASTNQIRTLSGAIMNSASIRTSIGELARVSTDFSYTSDTATTTIDATPAVCAVMCHIPFTFAHGTLEFPDMCVIAELQEAEITFNANPDLLYGIGSNAAVDAYRRLFEITGRFQASFVDHEQLDKVYAQVGLNCEAQLSEQPTLNLIFNNGEMCPATAERSITITGVGVGIADHGTNIEPNEPIFEEINWQLRSTTVTAVNNVAVEP